MRRFAAEGFTPESVDIVLSTHLHADHVGWDTLPPRRCVWTPTFTNARYLYVRDELEWHKGSWDPDRREVWQDAISPVFEAGLADVVECDDDLGGSGISLAPSPGHTGGHVSIWLASGDQVGLVTGDFMHHPLQFAEPTPSRDRRRRCRTSPRDSKQDDFPSIAASCSGHWHPFCASLRRSGRARRGSVAIQPRLTCARNPDR